MKQGYSASEEIILEPVDTDEINRLAKELLEESWKSVLDQPKNHWKSVKNR